MPRIYTHIAYRGTAPLFFNSGIWGASVLFNALTQEKVLMNLHVWATNKAHLLFFGKSLLSKWNTVRRTVAPWPHSILEVGEALYNQSS